MIDTELKQSKMIELYDESTPEMKRGLYSVILERVVYAESILSAVGVDTRGLEPRISDRVEEPAFIKSIRVQVAGTDAWLISAAKTHPL